jgi:uncharacterized membrane protein YtjA (UPF0391 family)
VAQGHKLTRVPGAVQREALLREKAPFQGEKRNICSRPGLIPRGLKGENEDFVMLSWVVTFLIIALIAGVLGFGGIAGASVEIAKMIFFIAVILFLVSAVVGLARGRTRV